MNNIVIVRADDWEVLYVNGRERLQGETISVQDIVQYAQNIEVTWEEHILMQSMAQKYSDSGVSKTINFPNKTHKETIGKAFMMAWKNNCKGITVYRNGSREVEVLSPKNVDKNKCPMCGEATVKYDGCTKCVKCEWSLCTVG